MLPHVATILDYIREVVAKMNKKKAPPALELHVLAK
jgi:uncharacterized protein YejL (UPF0352 family)